jgi:hypothetical protein
MVSRAGGVLDPSGALIDKAVAEQLQKFMRGFVELPAGEQPGLEKNPY